MKDQKIELPLLPPAASAEPRRIGKIIIDATGHPRARLNTGYDDQGNQWADGTPIYAAPVAAQPSVPVGSLVLDKGDVEFIAARVRRLCSKFNYPMDGKDDAFVVAVAGSIIGAILTNLELADRSAPPAAGQPSPCKHIFEARAINGVRSASGPFEAVCRECGYRPSAEQSPGTQPGRSSAGHGGVLVWVGERSVRLVANEEQFLHERFSGATLRDLAQRACALHRGTEEGEL